VAAYATRAEAGLWGFLQTRPPANATECEDSASPRARHTRMPFPAPPDSCARPRARSVCSPACPRARSVCSPACKDLPGRSVIASVCVRALSTLAKSGSATKCAPCRAGRRRTRGRAAAPSPPPSPSPSLTQSELGSILEDSPRLSRWEFASCVSSTQGAHTSLFQKGAMEQKEKRTSPWPPGRLAASKTLARKFPHIREGANELRRPLQSQQRLSLPLLHLRTSKNECTDPFRRCSN